MTLEQSLKNLGYMYQAYYAQNFTHYSEFNYSFFNLFNNNVTMQVRAVRRTYCG